MLSNIEIKNIFAQAKAIITGDHFVYAKKADGWYHGSDYVNKDAIYPYTRFVKRLCADIAQMYQYSEIEAVVGPTVGAISLAQWTADFLSSTNTQVLAVCADEEPVLEAREYTATDHFDFDFFANGKVEIKLSLIGVFLKACYQAEVAKQRVMKRGYDMHVKSKRCLIVEDVVNSGATVIKTRDAIVQAGGEVFGVGALCNRSGGKVTAKTLGVPKLLSLLDLKMEMFKEDDQGFCPICKERGRGSVRTDLGKGKDFLARFGLKLGDK